MWDHRDDDTNHVIVEIRYTQHTHTDDMMRLREADGVCIHTQQMTVKCMRLVSCCIHTCTYTTVCGNTAAEEKSRRILGTLAGAQNTVYDGIPVEYSSNTEYIFGLILKTTL